eukprot:TRINITY_DN17099_c0_g1_i1.p1 TRINITY_DN17099_c0_g1~~TRINITY_DN17099_c0_g1_i1.p1  ORF type:complete len:117 (+),score=6.12 TRINITY_DN17099_c0_g1_i1:106-456(+)
MQDKDQSVTEQVRDVYREKMPEALGGRPATLNEKAVDKPIVDKIKDSYRENIHKIQDTYQENIHKLKDTYRENMPEVLGGRPPTANEKAGWDPSGRQLNDPRVEGNQVQITPRSLL